MKKEEFKQYSELQEKCPDFKIPKYEIIEVEMKVLNQIKFCE